MDEQNQRHKKWPNAMFPVRPAHEVGGFYHWQKGVGEREEVVRDDGWVGKWEGVLSGGDLGEEKFGCKL